MRLRISREIKTPKYTIGKLYIDYQNGNGWFYFCDTLEDAERDVKIFGQTAIPTGQYRCINTFSQKFNQIMPLVQNVKGFDGIRIHSGNTEYDTNGCILVGVSQGSRLVNSVFTYNRLWPILKIEKHGYDLEIIDNYHTII